MATTPSDDPLDRTVGVRHIRLDHNSLKSLKREALLFDQIAIPGYRYNFATILDTPLLNHPRYRDAFKSIRTTFDDYLDWLRDRGIVREAGRETPFNLFNYDDFRDFVRQQLNAIVAETGEPIDVMSLPDQRMWKVWRRLTDSLMNNEPEVIRAVSLREQSMKLRRDGFNAFPIFENRRQMGDVFPSGTAPVLEVVLKSMPIPDDETPWEDIIEFRNDPEARDQRRELRVWTRKFAKETTSTSLAEMKEEIEVLLRRYERHMELHRMKVNKGATEMLLTVAGKVAEDFVKLKWGELAKLPFILRERKVSLLEAEAKAPNRELAFISIARSRFSR